MSNVIPKDVCYNCREEFFVHELIRPKQNQFMHSSGATWKLCDPCSDGMESSTSVAYGELYCYECFPNIECSNCHNKLNLKIPHISLEFKIVGAAELANITPDQKATFNIVGASIVFLKETYGYLPTVDEWIDTEIPRMEKDNQHGIRSSID